MSDWKPVETGIGRWQFETIKPSEVVTLAECQPRVDGTDNTLVAEYASDMQAYDAQYAEYDPKIYGWQKFPRLECVHVSDVGYILFSGFHRLAAIRSNDYTEIEVAFIGGTLQDAILLSKKANADNGKRRTNADKAHVVKSCLLDDELKQWSDRQIAKWCGVDHKTVARYEKELGNFPSEKGGELYTRPTRRKRLSKSGNIEWIDTAGIGNSTSTEKDGQEQTEAERIEMHQRDAVVNVAQVARKSLWKAFDRAGLGTHISPSDFAIVASKEMNWYIKGDDSSGEHYIEGNDILAPLSKLSLKEADMWLARFNIIEAAIEHQAEWVQKLIPVESVVPDLNSWEKAHQHAESVLLAFRNILKGLGVADVDACLDDILLFYDGLAYADVKVATEATLKQIASFYLPLLTQDVADWPEYIRESEYLPKAESKEGSGKKPEQEIQASSGLESLAAVAESLTAAIDDAVENAGIKGDMELMSILEKAAVHYSFDFQRFLFVTDMFDVDDVKSAAAYCESLVPPSIQSWIRTMKSMKRDIENGENWARAFASGSPVSETTKLPIEKVVIWYANSTTGKSDYLKFCDGYDSDSGFAFEKPLQALPSHIRKELQEILENTVSLEGD